MLILFIGDIVGKPGRKAVITHLPILKQKRKIHLVIANVENLAHGKGATVDTIEEIREAGVDFCTSGNHIWDTKDIWNKLNDKSFPLIRPANYPSGNPGRGYDVVKTQLMKTVYVVNLQGRVFMPEGVESPFAVMDRIMQELNSSKRSPIIIVDFHAEATSEKNAMRHYLDGKVTALIGTHTHVQTRDAHITPQGTAYITDVGMTGVYHNSVIGVDKNNSLDFFLLAHTLQWEIAQGDSLFQAVLVELDDKSGRAISVETIQEVISV